MLFPPDIHTHNQQATPGSAVVNLPQNFLLHPDSVDWQPEGLYSAGLHPWYLDGVEEKMAGLSQLLQNPQVVAVGECGLDRLAETDFALQCRVFEQQLRMAAEQHRFVIIHCVKAFDDLIRICRQIKAPEIRIVHGFRGKPQQARQLLNEGFGLSFGKYYNVQSWELCPSEKRFRETDEEKEI